MRTTVAQLLHHAGPGLGPSGGGGGGGASPAYYWLGTTSADQATPANWSLTDGGPPASTTPATTALVHFTSHGNHDCTLSADVEYGGIIMESGYTATLTVGGHDVTVNGDWTVAAGVVFGSMGATNINVGGNLDWQGAAGSLLNVKHTANWYLSVDGSADMAFCDIQHCINGTQVVERDGDNVTLRNGDYVLAGRDTLVDARVACTDSGDNYRVDFGSAVVTRAGDYVTERDADYVCIA